MLATITSIDTENKWYVKCPLENTQLPIHKDRASFSFSVFRLLHVFSALVDYYSFLHHVSKRFLAKLALRDNKL